MILDIVKTAAMLVGVLKSSPERTAFKLSKKKDRWAGRQHRKIVRALKKLTKQNFTNRQKRTIFLLSYPQLNKEIYDIFPD